MRLIGTDEDRVAVLQMVEDLQGVARRFGDALPRDDLDALYEAMRTLDFIARKIYPAQEGNPERSGGAPAALR